MKWKWDSNPGSSQKGEHAQTTEPIELPHFWLSVRLNWSMKPIKLKHFPLQKWNSNQDSQHKATPPSDTQTTEPPEILFFRDIYFFIIIVFLGQYLSLFIIQLKLKNIPPQKWDLNQDSPCKGVAAEPEKLPQLNFVFLEGVLSELIIKTNETKAFSNLKLKHYSTTVRTEPGFSTWGRHSHLWHLYLHIISYYFFYLFLSMFNQKHIIINHSFMC